MNIDIVQKCCTEHSQSKRIQADIARVRTVPDRKFKANYVMCNWSLDHCRQNPGIYRAASVYLCIILLLCIFYYWKLLYV